jgi:hypothetical protein
MDHRRVPFPPFQTMSPPICGALAGHHTTWDKVRHKTFCALSWCARARHLVTDLACRVAELCNQDSDGDGKTNGEELGDPCCVWKPSALTTVGEGYRISHPGHKEDVTDSPGPSAAECQALVKSQGAAAAFDEAAWVDSLYNPGEERANISFSYASSAV